MNNLITGWLLVMGSFDPSAGITTGDYATTTYYEYQGDCESVKIDRRVIESYKPIYEVDGKQFRIWCEPVKH